VNLGTDIHIVEITEGDADKARAFPFHSLLEVFIIKILGEEIILDYGMTCPIQGICYH
jgi:hypothetical protein